MTHFTYSLAALLACLLALTACPMDTKTTLPRNMSLKAFDPHRPSFECKHEADQVPPIDPEAEMWFQEGMRVTRRDLRPDQRDYPQAVALWSKAAERKHWKAMLNLASVLIEGGGEGSFAVPAQTERAVQIVEEAMRLGIPSAFDLMGSLHQQALGVKGDISRAYALWELAADMGSPRAQAFIGDKLNATYDNPQEGFWGNEKVAIKMLECSFSQGHGKGAYFLGSDLNNSAKDYARALKVLHEGVKMGSEDCAISLSVGFDGLDPLTGNQPGGEARSERYSVLADALYLNPDLRFPNLDKVLPLPPAPLPKWDGNKQTLIDAAKAVVPAPTPGPKPAASPASQRTGRAHIPEGYMLPHQPQVEVAAQYETTRAPEAGYWLAQLMYPRSERHARWNAEQVPLRYAAGELFDRTRPGLVDEDGRIRFHYLGQAVPVPVIEVPVNPRVAQGIAREATLPEPPLECLGDERCPATGIWAASVSDDHPHAAVFNHWSRQSYVMRGERFPDPRELHLDIEPMQVAWHYRGEANEQRTPTLAFIRVGDPEPKVMEAAADASPDDPPAAAAPDTQAAAQTPAKASQKRRWWQRS